MPILVRRRRVDVEHGVVEIRVCVTSSARPKPLVTLSGSEERHVFHQVRQPLFVFAFVDAPHVHLQVRLESPFGNLVGQNHLLESILQRTSSNFFVRREFLIE